MTVATTYAPLPDAEPRYQTRIELRVDGGVSSNTSEQKPSGSAAKHYATQWISVNPPCAIGPCRYGVQLDNMG